MASKAPERAKPKTAGDGGRNRVHRRIIVDPEFQWRMVMPIVLFVVIFVILVGVFVFFPLYRNAAYDPNPIVRALLDEQILNLHTRLWPMLAAAALLSGIYSLVRSNRIVAPMYELKRGLMQMIAGKYEKINLRNNAEFREFEDIANRLALTLDSLSTTNLRKATTLEKRLKFLKSRLEVRDLEKGEIISELDDLIKEVSHVQVAGSAAAKDGEIQ